MGLFSYYIGIDGRGVYELKENFFLVVLREKGIIYEDVMCGV